MPTTVLPPAIVAMVLARCGANIFDLGWYPVPIERG
jgi:hypothetical protein